MGKKLPKKVLGAVDRIGAWLRSEGEDLRFHQFKNPPDDPCIQFVVEGQPFHGSHRESFIRFLLNEGFVLDHVNPKLCGKWHGGSCGVIPLARFELIFEGLKHQFLDEPSIQVVLVPENGLAALRDYGHIVYYD